MQECFEEFIDKHYNETKLKLDKQKQKMKKKVYSESTTTEAALKDDNPVNFDQILKNMSSSDTSEIVEAPKFDPQNSLKSYLLES